MVRERREAGVEGVRDDHGLQQLVLLVVGDGGGLAFGAHVCFFVFTPWTQVVVYHKFLKIP